MGHGVGSVEQLSCSAELQLHPEVRIVSESVVRACVRVRA